MISALRNRDGFAYAWMVWRIVDENGHPNDAGRYIYICHVWIHEIFRGTRTIKELFCTMLDDPRAQGKAGAYWENLKRNEKPTPLYPIEKLAKLAGKETSQCVLS